MPRAAAPPDVRVNARSRAGAVTACSPPPADVANTGAVLARVGPTTRSDCWAAHGSPTDPIGRALPTGCGLRAGAGERRDAVPRRIRRACPPPIRRAARRSRRDRFPGEHARQHRAVPDECHASPPRQSQLTASCGCAREAPLKDLALRSGRERAAALAAPTGYDRTPGTSAHPQAKTMHAGSAPVIRLEGPLALGHDVLLVVLPSGRSDVSHRARLRFDRRWSWCYWPARSPVVRVAAVSPTFGRLFEGTDEASPGQTWLATTNPHRGVAKISVSITLAAAVATITIRSKPHVP